MRNSKLSKNCSKSRNNSDLPNYEHSYKEYFNKVARNLDIEMEFYERQKKALLETQNSTNKFSRGSSVEDLDIV